MRMFEDIKREYYNFYKRSRYFFLTWQLTLILIFFVVRNNKGDILIVLMWIGILVIYLLYYWKNKKRIVQKIVVADGKIITTVNAFLHKRPEGGSFYSLDLGYLIRKETLIPVFYQQSAENLIIYNFQWQKYIVFKYRKNLLYGTMLDKKSLQQLLPEEIKRKQFVKSNMTRVVFLTSIYKQLKEEKILGLHDDHLLLEQIKSGKKKFISRTVALAGGQKYLYVAEIDEHTKLFI